MDNLHRQNEDRNDDEEAHGAYEVRYNPRDATAHRESYHWYGAAHSFLSPILFLSLSLSLVHFYTPSHLALTARILLRVVVKSEAAA